MSSPFAERFHRQGRPQLFKLHGEHVDIVDNDLRSIEERTVIWLRVDPQAENSEGLGVDTAYAKAEAIIHLDDLPLPHGGLLIIREQEQWRIERAELQDAWTWKLHLERARDELRLPSALR